MAGGGGQDPGPLRRGRRGPGGGLRHLGDQRRGAGGARLARLSPRPSRGKRGEGEEGCRPARCQLLPVFWGGFFYRLQEKG